MEKNIVRCSRCGREFKLTLKQVFDGVTCPHCNKKFVLDKKSKRRLKFARYLFVLIVCLIAMFFTKNAIEANMVTGLLVVIALMAVMFMLSQYADKFCGRILFYTFGMQYTDNIEEEKEKGK